MGFTRSNILHRFLPFLLTVLLLVHCPEIGFASNVGDSLVIGIQSTKTLTIRPFEPLERDMLSVYNLLYEGLLTIDDDEIPQGAGEEGENTPESDDIFVEDEKVPAPAARKVTVYTSLGQNVQLGDTIYLSARLEGFEDCGELRYQWECNKGGGFAPVEGATSLSTSYIATAESLSWAWRLKVLYK